MKIGELDTPALVVDLDRLQANIDRLQGYLDKYGIANRPHIKTHKTPQIAQMQLAAGAAGITCQKIGEAEVMADAGCSDIFLPYNIVGEAKLARLAALARRVKLSLTADSAFTVQGYARTAQEAGIELEVLVEFDSGLGRCGVQTPQEAAELALQIANAPNLRFVGLMTFPGNAYCDRFVQETRVLLRTDGIPVDRISYGGTPTMWQAHERSEVTEYRAGTYIYGDRAIVRSGAMALDQVALHVIATVVSRPTGDRAILDAGSKTLSSDLSGLDGYGLILEYPDARIHKTSEEHGFVDLSRCAQKPQIGERVTIVPNHVCVVVNLFDEVFGARGVVTEVIWPVAARGKMR
ncbi:MAG: D-TA family PLP-dependent enzyme [Anaerolineae bacterium]|nr:D-TA family PLP-dependent enzyme [Anaerolineae bacterium]